MRRLWKNFRINLMYWRFRHITRNRLRFQSWYRRRQPAVRPYRPRGTAQYVTYRGSARRSWMALLAMVCLLTALRLWGNHSSVSSSLVYLLSVLIIVGAIYWSLRGV